MGGPSTSAPPLQEHLQPQGHAPPRGWQPDPAPAPAPGSYLAPAPDQAQAAYHPPPQQLYALGAPAPQQQYAPGPGPGQHPAGPDQIPVGPGPQYVPGPQAGPQAAPLPRPITLAPPPMAPITLRPPRPVYGARGRGHHPGEAPSFMPQAWHDRLCVCGSYVLSNTVPCEGVGCLQLSRGCFRKSPQVLCKYVTDSSLALS